MAFFKPLMSNHKLFTLYLILFSLSLVYLIFTFRPRINIRIGSDTLKLQVSTGTLGQSRMQNPRWFDLIAEEIKGRKVKVGLVNIGDDEEGLYRMHGTAETVNVRFDRVSKDRKWEEFFPEWIDENQKQDPPKCPDIPMPRLEDYRDLDVVVAKVPCDGWTGKAGVRDVFRLQVNLAVANILVASGWVKPNVDRELLAVFEGFCGPMQEIFRCDDLLKQVGNYWVYKPELRRLKQKVLMPVGSCQIGLPYAETGEL